MRDAVGVAAARSARRSRRLASAAPAFSALDLLLEALARHGVHAEGREQLAQDVVGRQCRRARAPRGSGAISASTKCRTASRIISCSSLHWYTAALPRELDWPVKTRHGAWRRSKHRFEALQVRSRPGAVPDGRLRRLLPDRVRRQLAAAPHLPRCGSSVMTALSLVFYGYSRRPLRRGCCSAARRRRTGPSAGPSPTALGPDGEPHAESIDLVRAAVVVNLGVLGFFKYYGFFVDVVADALDSIGLDVSPPLLADHPAGRHLVLHVPGDQLRHRHLPRRASEPVPLARLRASTCRSSRTSSPARSCGRASSLPAARASAPTRAASTSAEAFLLIVARPVQEGRDLELPRHRARRPGVRRARRRTARSSSWSRVYAYAIQIYADFTGYTDIAIGCALLLGFRFPQNFDAPYRAAVAPGLLAPLAHDAVALAARLPLHPARRQPRRRARARTAT